MKALLVALLCGVSACAAAAQSPGTVNGHGQPATLAVTPIPLSTFANLPTCNAAHKGMLFVVTDANGPTFGSTISGGSTTLTLGLCNGSVWTAR